MHISYISTYDAQNIISWSGTPYFIAKTLEEQGFLVNYIGNLKIKNLLWHRIKRYSYHRFKNEIYDFERDPRVIKSYSEQISLRLKDIKTDIIVSNSTIPIALLDTIHPIVVFTDASFAGMQEFYPKFIKMCKETKRYGNLMEQEALNRCGLVIYSSEWAMKSTINNYHIDHSKLKVLNYGANIDQIRDSDRIDKLIKSRDRGICHLLYVGVEWERKGGDTAIELVKKLNDDGFKSDLTIIGEQLKNQKNYPNYVHFTGFIKKSEKKGIELMEKIYSDSHFFVLPTIADCTPIVFPEANSFGIPVLTTNVGGNPSVIKNDVNGKLFEIDSFLDESFIYIIELFGDYEKYIAMAQSSFNEYQTRLNWRIIGKQLKEYLLEIK